MCVTTLVLQSGHTHLDGGCIPLGVFFLVVTNASLMSLVPFLFPEIVYVLISYNQSLLEPFVF